MKEYQFKVPNGVWLDVHANSEEEAVETLNASLHLLDQPLPAPGRIQRVQVDVREPITADSIVSVYDLATGESYLPNAPRQPEPASGDRLHADGGQEVEHAD